MDEFKIVIIVAVLVSLATLGTIIYISEDAINNAKIPDITRGIVASKTVVTDKPSANYSITLSDSRTLYIQNKSALYDSIIVSEEQTYTFDCRIDYTHNTVLIDSVNPQGGLVISKASVTDKPAVGYAVNLANGRTIYIANNATLYDSLIINQTYLFDCRIDYNNNMFVINSAQLVAASNP
jgi:hypothetical protein